MNWISVKDRFPEEFQEVLVVKHFRNKMGYKGQEFDTIPYITIDRVDRKNLWNDEVTWQKAGINTHWMPLPEMPKKEESHG